MPDYQEAQGEAIERLQRYAAEEITREDFATMNCATFTDMNHVCSFIGETHCIDSDDRVYTALRTLGAKRCYHEYRRNNNHDVFSEIAKLVKAGKTSRNFSKREAAQVNVMIFSDVHTKKFGSSRQDVKIANSSAGAWRIQTSHLNLYYALTGLKYIVENEPAHIDLRDDPLFDDPLRVLTKANMRLNDRKEYLQVWMGI